MLAAIARWWRERWISGRRAAELLHHGPPFRLSRGLDGEMAMVFDRITEDQVDALRKVWRDRYTGPNAWLAAQRASKLTVSDLIATRDALDAAYPTLPIGMNVSSHGDVELLVDRDAYLAAGLSEEEIDGILERLRKYARRQRFDRDEP